MSELSEIQSRIEKWFITEADRIKNLYHYEIHRKVAKRSHILNLETSEGAKKGHEECAKFLAQNVSGFLKDQILLNKEAQDILLDEVSTVFTKEDNSILDKTPDKEEIFEILKKSNLRASPGTDGLTGLLYYKHFDILGEPLTKVIEEIHRGRSPTNSQNTSMMIFADKPKKAGSLLVKDKCTISLLNADYKLITGI